MNAPRNQPATIQYSVPSQKTLFLEFNAIAHRRLGYSREEFSKLSIFDIEAQETAEQTREHIPEVMRVGKADFETVQRTKQGELRNIQVTAQIVDIEG